MYYKVWIEVEQIDEDTDHYENIAEPIDVAIFNTMEAALDFSERLEAIAESIRPDWVVTERN